MTELKTLKDLGTKNSARDDGTWSCMSCNNPEFVELKAEAIKWVKHFRDDKNCEACESGDTFVTGWEDEPVLEEVAGIISVLKHFFNITEEDLK